MATSVFDLDLPVLDFLDAGLTFDEQADRVAGAAKQSWIARNPFGFSVLRYDDVVAVLRDKRWHSASSRILEMYGIDDPKYTERNRESILSAEGEVHT
ncbi:MAG: hypothetical protein ACRDZZ_11005, partial [Ilumatobacteraceae bacterium]